MRLLVIIPAYNEEGSIERVVDNLIQNHSQYDYVVVNDGSTDRTAEICARSGYRVLSLKTNTGLACAFQTGLRLAYEEGYDYAIQFDGDGQHEAACIQGLLDEMLARNADIVIGPRFVSGKKSFGPRMLGNRLLEWAIRLTTGVRIKDPTSGMRLLNRAMIREFATSMNYGPEPDTLAYLLHNHVKVCEVQVEMHERTAGDSYLNIVSSMRYMLRMVISILLFQNFRKREESL